LLNAPEVTSLQGKHDGAIKGGSTWRLSWTCTPARSSAGPCWGE
jgi:hypothetical protein